MNRSFSLFFFSFFSLFDKLVLQRGRLGVETRSVDRDVTSLIYQYQHMYARGWKKNDKQKNVHWYEEGDRIIVDTQREVSSDEFARIASPD